MKIMKSGIRKNRKILCNRNHKGSVLHRVLWLLLFLPHVLHKVRLSFVNQQTRPRFNVEVSPVCNEVLADNKKIYRSEIL